MRDRPGSAMCKVLLLIERGVSDRTVMAQETGCSLQQVHQAIYNLRFYGYIVAVKRTSKGYHQGSGESIYKLTGATHAKPRARARPLASGNPLHGVASIFSVEVSK